MPLIRTRPSRAPATSSSQGGVALLEALIAVIIFSIGILGLIGLQANATKSTTQAKFRVDASQIASQRVAAMWVDQGNLAGYNEADTPIAELPGGTRTTVIAGSQATVSISWQMPGDSAVNTYQTVAQITSN
jgi:type IV pilus assembly protein PilV